MPSDPPPASASDRSTTPDSDRSTAALDPEAYLARLGLDPAAVEPQGLDSLQHLQSTHVTTVPFETLAITGDPYGDREGAGVSLALPDVYEKVVERGRGGFCYELNGLFGWLLGALGYDAERVAAMVVGDDGAARPPANHLTHVVTLDRRYVVDVGLGVPPMRRPLPLDGEPRSDAAGTDAASDVGSDVAGPVREDHTGVEWRVVESDRPDADYATEFREPGDEAWTLRYVFRDQPREMDYFAATCEYLATAPESPFTGEPTATLGTDEGYLRLSPDALVRVRGDEEREEPIEDGAAYHDVLEEEFGLRYRRG